jgi:hypothetical protein
MLVRRNARHRPRTSVRCDETVQATLAGELGESSRLLAQQLAANALETAAERRPAVRCSAEVARRVETATFGG